jgi:uncharacterized alpha-E superfamily protein
MLSRTADHLFWMARYMERAENTARMLDINLKALLLPQTPEQEARTQRSVLRISELEAAYAQRYDDAVPVREHVLGFMVTDPANPSSIHTCLQAARENARAVRGTLTTEWWETINDTWLEFNERTAAGQLGASPDSLFEWVKFRSHLSRGVTIGTALQDDAFFFTQLGTFLERADNTARILDVRFADLEPNSRDAARQLEDFYYWTSILSSVSALEIYRKVYRDAVTPARVVELMILNPQMPRSLLASLEGVCANLAMLRTQGSSQCERFAGKLRAELLYADIRQIFEAGLHAWLTQFLGRVYELGNRVAQTYLMLPVA